MGPGRYSVVLITSALSGLMLSPPSFGQTDASNVVKCAKIPDRDRRLSCYDRTVNEMVIEMQTQPIEAQILDSGSERESAVIQDSGPERKSAAIQPREKEPFWKFWGLKKSREERAKESKGLRTQLARFVKGPRGTYTFYLSNGQVWRQKYDQTLSSLKVGDIVLLKQTAMGGFDIKVGRNVPVQVSRVR